MLSRAGLNAIAAFAATTPQADAAVSTSQDLWRGRPVSTMAVPIASGAARGAT